MIRLVSTLILVLAALAAVPAWAQTKPAADKSLDNMSYLREKLKVDKKQVVAANMDLTEAEAKKFWPLYEEYQKELHQINDRLAMVIVSYSKDYNANALTDARAKALLDRYLAIEESEIKMKKSFAGKLAKALPGRKATRYMQLENKIRALVKYELAGEVPLAQ